MKILEKYNLVDWMMGALGASLVFHIRYIFGDPGSTSYFEYGTISIYLFDILFVIVSILFWSRNEFRTWVAERARGLSIFQCFLISSGVFILLLGGVVGSSFVVWFRWALVLIEIITIFFYISFAGGRNFFIGLLIALTIQNIFAVIQFFVQYVPESKWLGLAAHNPLDLGQSVVVYAGERVLRAYGFAPHPNILGGMGLITLLLLWMNRINPLKNTENINGKMKQTSHMSRILWYASYMCALSALFFSFSRTAVVGGVFLSVGIVFVFRKIIHKHIGPLLATIALGAILLFQYHTIWFARIDNNFPLVYRAVQERRALFMEWQTIISDPKVFLFGTGLGQYESYVHTTIMKKNIWEYQPVHSVIALVFAEFGVVGTSIFLILLGCMCVRVREWRWLLIALATLLPSLMFDHYWWTSMLSFIVITLVYYYSFISSKSFDSTHSREVH